MAPPAQEDALGELPLSRSCACGDRAAFARLYQATSAKLYGVALRILRREDWAEEVLQECYVNIWRHAPDYSAEPGRADDVDDQHRAQPLPRLAAPAQPGAAGRGRGATKPSRTAAPARSTELERSQEAGALARCLRELEAKQRQAIALAFFDGLSHAELAQHLREPLGTVKTWVRRGLAEAEELP